MREVVPWWLTAALLSREAVLAVALGSVYACLGLYNQALELAFLVAEMLRNRKGVSA